MSEHIVFADTEGNDFLAGLTTIWTIQLAHGVDGEVLVYADQPGYPSIKEGLKVLKEAEKVVFHNAFGYDFFAVNKLYPGTLRREQIIDTLIISRLMDSTATRHNLASMGEGLGFAKGDHTDFSRFSEEMVTYGKVDVQILQKAWKGEPSRKFRSFGKFYKDFRLACENEFYTAFVLEKQRQHGFRLDYEKAQMLEAELRQEYVSIERGLQDIFPPITTERISEKTGKRLKDNVEVFNPGSRDQIADRLIAKYGWKPTSKTTTGKAKVDEEILSSLPYPEAKEVARYLTMGKMVGQLSDGKGAWLKLAEAKPDGTYYCHGYVNTLGARTHRMSHSGPNMAQVNKDHRMRDVWVPDRGDILVGVDAEGLELRMLAHYLFMYDQGAYADFVHKGDKKNGTDVHSMNMKAAGLFLRDSAKTMIYAHNYGCFDKKLGTIIVDDAKAAGQTVPKGSLTALGAVLRAELEVGVVGLGPLIEKCKLLHHKKGALPGLDGRWIPSASDHSALNTLLQGNGSIVMKVALNEFDREIEKLQLIDKVGYCANVHDEFQLSVNPDVVDKVIEVGKWSFTKAEEILAVRCPLVGDAKSGKSWAETH